MSGLFLCFDIANAIESLRLLLTSQMRELSGVCAIILFGEIGVCSRCTKEHKKHLEALFDIMKKENLYAEIAKCEAGYLGVEFFEHLGSADGLDVHDNLKTVILDRAVAFTSSHMLQFTNLQNHIMYILCEVKLFEGCASTLRPISDILRSKKLIWSEELKTAIEQLKKEPTEALMIAHALSDKQLWCKLVLRSLRWKPA